MHRKLFTCHLIFFVMYISPVVCWAKTSVNVDGTCAQLNTVIDKAQSQDSVELSLEDSVIFLTYRAAANGQASIYNLALLSSGYDRPLLAAKIAKPDTFFFKKVIADCKQNSYQIEYPLVVVKTIFNIIKGLYPDRQNINLNFEKLLQELPEPFPTDRIIGLGNKSCGVVTADLRENPIESNIYNAWLSGYLSPYMMTKQLESEQSLELIDNVLQKTISHCKGNQSVKFAHEALMIFKTIYFSKYSNEKK